MSVLYCACVSLLLAQLCALGAARCTETKGSNEFRSDYTFSQEAAGWLKLHRVPMDWHAARVQCYHEGAMLASPLSADLWTALTNLLSKAELDLTHVYSGASATLNGVFSSVEGVPLEQLYIQWDKGQPNNLDGNQQCVTYYKRDDTLTVHDESCKNLFPFVCYRPASESDKLTECGTVDTEYKLDARTGHCYKFHRHGMEWASAARVCQAEGGYLAVIDSQPEADLLAELFAAQPTLLHTNYEDIAFTGFKKWGNDNFWWTIHGKLLEDSGYSRWSQGQPNNLGEDQRCGAIHRDGLLDDVWCEGYPMAFICEKSPDSLTRDPPTP